MSQSQADDERPEDSFLENNTVSQTSHVLFGSMMKESLTPLNLEVESDYEVGKGPPKLDVLIIRRAGARWSKAQLEFLPDGIRQSNCKHVILELKYTESINKTAIFQTIGYLGSYLRLKQFKPEKVCAFIVSSKTPQKRVLKQIGFEQADIKGVYRSKDCLLSNIQLISLNDLSDAPYNLWIKLFSSKIKQRLSVLKRILAFDLKKFNSGLVSILVKILNFWNMIGEISMQRIQKDILYESDGISDELAAWFLSMFKPEDRLRGLQLEDIFKQFKPEDVFKQFKPEDRLNGLDLKIIEDYLKTKKKNDSSFGK
ncbi:MAG: hypothetical protein OMM_03379 [Candidatus Magnetoglobus multicellularis str. Araruama]|uniref:Uncharacterized protein n=1 Tax=Candidatus Magnetoglobus multicellularis str. Araruama TaxID=890399 RepID=A0A1V1P631_9BACT|nr:MAG: hypothetical protein OMM_03379 [Candidatus Magnetoglobus multicellularis str. Araruama]